MRKPSRVTKFGYIVIFALVGVWLVSALLIFGLTLFAEKVGLSDSGYNLVEKVASYLQIDVAGAIGTIATSVIVRYGAREVTANLTGKEREFHNSATEREERGERK